MATTEQKVSAAVVVVEGEIRRGDARLQIATGRGDRTEERFLEFKLPDAAASVRAEWSEEEARSESASAFVFTLIVNDSTPEKVIYVDGLLFDHEQRKAARDEIEPLGREELLPFWECFNVLGLQEKVTGQPVAMRFGFGDWLGCMADSAGAGAGIGAGIGFVAGSIPGAEAGAVIGGGLGSAFGLGYCTTTAILD